MRLRAVVAELRYDTCATTYCFADGTSALVFDEPKLSVLIKFHNHQQIQVIQETISSDLHDVGDKNGSKIWFQGGNGNSIEEAVIIRGALCDLVGTWGEFQWLTGKFGQKDVAWELFRTLTGWRADGTSTL